MTTATTTTATQQTQRTTRCDAKKKITQKKYYKISMYFSHKHSHIWAAEPTESERVSQRLSKWTNERTNEWIKTTNRAKADRDSSSSSSSKPNTQKSSNNSGQQNRVCVCVCFFYISFLFISSSTSLFVVARCWAYCRSLCYSICVVVRCTVLCVFLTSSSGGGGDHIYMFSRSSCVYYIVYTLGSRCTTPRHTLFVSLYKYMWLSVTRSLRCVFLSLSTGDES